MSCINCTLVGSVNCNDLCPEWRRIEEQELAQMDRAPLSDEMGYDPAYELKPAQPKTCPDCAYNQQIDVSKCLECGIDFAEPSRIRNESWLPK